MPDSLSVSIEAMRASLQNEIARISSAHVYSPEECGWLKLAEYTDGSALYEKPSGENFLFPAKARRIVIVTQAL